MKRRNRRYILLGLGFGIILTNIIYYYNPKIETEELDDSDVVERAQELGMVSMKDSISTDSDEKKVEDAEVGKKQEEVDSADKEENQEELAKDQGEDVSESESKEKMEEEIKPEEKVEGNLPEEPVQEKKPEIKTTTLTIKVGDGVTQVSRRLKSMGFIENSRQFKNKVYSKGYAKRVQPGSFSISSDMSEDELIRVITTRPRR